MKKINEFSRITIDLEFVPYQATFRNSLCMEVVVKGFSNSNITEAIEQAQGALYDDIYERYCDDGAEIIDEVYNSYKLVEIKVI